MLAHWLRTLSNRLRGRDRQPARRTRLRVEPLEERVMFATHVFTVDTVEDEVSSNGRTSLREAILQANATDPGDEVIINLQPNAAYKIQRDTYQALDGNLVHTDNHIRDGEFGDFDITRSVTINGHGAFVGGEQLGRVFQVKGGNVTFGDMVILNGGGSGITTGAGMHVSGGANVALNGVRFFNNVTVASGDSRGGALYVDNFSTVAISGCWFDDNAARGSASGSAYGGAIYLARGRLEVFGTEFDGNSAVGGDAAEPGAGGGLAYGGAVYVANGEAVLDTTTFTNNRAVAGDGAGGGAGGSARGGAVAINLGRLDAQNTSFTGNIAEAGRGGDGSVPGGIGGLGHGGAGGSAHGGALYVGPGGITLNLLDSAFRDNAAQGGTGGDGTVAGGVGGESRGGALATESLSFSSANSFSIRRTDFQLNAADAGAGGIADDGTGGRGGDAYGGAVSATFGTLDFKDSPFIGNRAMAGDGGSVWEGPAGNGGHGFGGAVYLGGSVATSIRGFLSSDGIDDNTALGIMLSNQAMGGSGGHKLYSADHRAGDDDAAGNGGEARGGAVAAEGSTLYVEEILFAANGAFAGNGGAGNANQDSHPDAVGTAGGNNGFARGGALFTQVDSRLIDVAFASNKAVGGRLDRTQADPSTLADNQGIAGGAGGLNADRQALNGGRGGSAYGGAVNAYGTADLEVTRGTFLDNQALGSAGGAGSFGLPGSDPDGTDTAGSGGRGGEAFGGAIRGDLTGGSITVTNSLMSGNLAIAGKGGSGGFGVGTGTLRPYFDDEDVIPNTDGGDGGDGGNAGGAGMSVWNPTGFGTTAVNLTDVTVLANSAAGGDGGFAASGDGRGGNGGDGGDATGGGLHLDGVTTTLESVTVEGNVISSGWGADGGAGGQTFLVWAGGEAVYGNDGGDGGEAGDASGAGIALVRGTLQMSHSTVVNNLAYAGPGGDGGSGGNGDYGSGNGGDGGDAGAARGGGVYIANGASANLTAATVAHNQINTSIGGHAGLAGVMGSQTEAPPMQYGPAPDTVLADGAMSVFMSGPASASVNFTTVATSLSVPSGLNFDQATFSTATIYAASYAVALPVFAGAELAAALTASLAVIRVVETGGLFIDDAVEMATSASFALVPGASGTIGATFAVFTGGASIVAVVGIMLTRALVEGALTGDYEAAFYHTMGSPHQDETFRYDQRLQYGFIPNEEPEEGTPIDLPPGVNGASGVAGVAEGTGLWGAGSLSRTIVAANVANERTRTIEERVITETPPGTSFPITRTVYEEREHFTPLGREDVKGTFSSDGTNLIGAVHSGFTFDLRGTVAAPLDARLDTETAMWGGKTPTLKPLPGSPARGALLLPGIDLSQNDYLWAGVTDIGAWGGPANRAPNADHGPLTTAEDTTLTAPLASDPDGDPLQLVSEAPVGQNGTVEVVNGQLKYTSNADWFGRETLTYQVTDGVLTRTVTTIIDVTPVNDKPVIHGERQASHLPVELYFQTPEDTPIEIDLSQYVSDLETPAGELHFEVGLGDWGTVELLADGRTVRLTPAPNHTGGADFLFTVKDPEGASEFGIVIIDFLSVADAPSVEGVTTDEDTQSDGIIVRRNAADGADVGHFQVTGITGGTLFLSDGVTPVRDGDFVTFAQGPAGLRFTPAAAFSGAAGFLVRASIGATDAGLGGDTVQALVTVNPVADAPTVSTPAATGDEGSTIPLDIRAALTDMDGSETLSIRIDGVPIDAVLSAGTRSDNGSWTLTPEQLEGLMMTVPDDGAFTLRVTAVAKEAANQSTAITAADLSVTVNNVAPTLAALGLPAADAREPYTLMLASSDLGRDAIRHWTLNWGDGVVEQVAGSGAVTVASHRYALRSGRYTITVTATDEDGTYAATPLAVTMTFPEKSTGEVADRFFALTGVTLDPERLAQWSAELGRAIRAKRGAAGRRRLRARIWQSPEYRTRVIRQWFLDCGREPSAEEVARLVARSYRTMVLRSEVCKPQG